MLFRIFRFRRKTGRILSIYYCFCDLEERALHPSQITRETGIDLVLVVQTLNSVNELFMKLPGRGDGITRYGMPSRIYTMQTDEVIALVQKHARIENWIFWSIWASILTAFTIAAFFVFSSMFTSS